MAVDENFRRKGIAEALSLASLEKAKELDAIKVILYSNTKNANAIKLYEKIGFKHLPVEAGVYERANVKMEIAVPLRSYRSEMPPSPKGGNREELSKD